MQKWRRAAAITLAGACVLLFLTAVFCCLATRHLSLAKIHGGYQWKLAAESGARMIELSVQFPARHWLRPVRQMTGHATQKPNWDRPWDMNVGPFALRRQILGIAIPDDGKDHPKVDQYGLVDYLEWWHLTLPAWFVLLASAPFPAWYIPRCIRRATIQRRLAQNLCLSCGYDLRASLERCPECGTPRQAQISAV